MDRKNMDNYNGYGSYNNYTNREDSDEAIDIPEDLIVVDFVDWLKDEGLALYMEKKAEENYDFTNQTKNYIDLTRSDFSQKKQKLPKINKKRKD